MDSLSAGDSPCRETGVVSVPRNASEGRRKVGRRMSRRGGLGGEGPERSFVPMVLPARDPGERGARCDCSMDSREQSEFRLGYARLRQAMPVGTPAAPGGWRDPRAGWGAADQGLRGSPRKTSRRCQFTNAGSGSCASSCGFRTGRPRALTNCRKASLVPLSSCETNMAADVEDQRAHGFRVRPRPDRGGIADEHLGETLEAGVLVILGGRRCWLRARCFRLAGFCPRFRMFAGRDVRKCRSTPLAGRPARKARLRGFLRSSRRTLGGLLQPPPLLLRRTHNGEPIKDNAMNVPDPSGWPSVFSLVLLGYVPPKHGISDRPSVDGNFTLKPRSSTL